MYRHPSEKRNIACRTGGFHPRGERYQRAMARAIWSGTISFGLVSVPLKMFSATESKELRFHVVHREDLTPIGYDKVRKDTGEHVEQTKKKSKPRRRARAKKAS
jgi:hypothetical protein